VPRRKLSPSEAHRIVELQGNRLRELLDVQSPDLPDSAITDLPRIVVGYEARLPVSGVTAWHNGRWHILINSLEDFSRQRFSLAHELFHVVNYPTLSFLLPGAEQFSPSAERLAEYFGGCLLVPKRHLLRLVGEGQRGQDLANIFGVSRRAINVRMQQLKLIDPPLICGQPLGWRITAVRPAPTETVEVSHA
jgi:Zn-dependent peptidase ImmA (M78 family)